MTPPILSSYVEATGNPQTVPTGGNVAFSDIDIVGTDITYSAANSTFTILRPGLYHIEWSINKAAGNTGASIVGITENGQSTSAIAGSTTAGNSSSGALIHVTTVPYTITLTNFATPLILDAPAGTEQISASFRIHRFADGPTV